MSHLPIMPVLVPMFVGALLLVLRGSLDMKRALALLATLVQVLLASLLMVQASQGTQVYALGNWMPPFGIVLVVDRLSALLLLVTSVLASGALLYAIRGDDAAGRNFQAPLPCVTGKRLVPQLIEADHWPGALLRDGSDTSTLTDDCDTNEGDLTDLPRGMCEGIAEVIFSASSGSKTRPDITAKSPPRRQEGADRLGKGGGCEALRHAEQRRRARSRSGLRSLQRCAHEESGEQTPDSLGRAIRDHPPRHAAP